MPVSIEPIDVARDAATFLQIVAAIQESDRESDDLLQDILEIISSAGYDIQY